MPPRPPDPSSFELVVVLRQSTRRAWFIACVLALTTMCASAALFVQASRPFPIVYRPDSATDPLQVLYAGGKEVPVREIDAKRFFLRAGDLLHAWSSASVVKDLTAASMLMSIKWRKQFSAEVNAIRDVPVDISKDGRETQLGYYAGLRVRNTVDWVWDSITCERNDAERTWGCYGRAVIETQPLVGDPLPYPPRKELVIRASFVEVPVTGATIDGLLIDFWDQRDAGAEPAKAVSR